MKSFFRWWNFPFKNLFLQFSNKANLYFLFIGLLQIIPAISTTNGTPTIYVPLAFIVLVSAARAAIEDRQRHIADAERNNCKYERAKFRRVNLELNEAGLEVTPRSSQREALLDRARGSGDQSELETTTSGELKCGDIVKVYKDQMVPCDMILLSSSEEKGHCFIDKANLNGETSLEVMVSLPALRKYCNEHGTRFGSLSVEMDWEAPSSNFEQFRCHLNLIENNTKIPVAVNHKNLLLRETILRNTEYVYGLAVYTGDDTKIRRSIAEGEKPSPKNSRIMILVDKYMVMMFLVLGLLCLVGGIYSGVWQSTRAKHHWYLRLHLSGWDGLVTVLASTGSWLILLSAMVPISLVVTAQVVKFIQSFFISFDLRFWNIATQKGARCNTSTIHEDLGLVDFIFSDKTGTLTQNKMDFRYAYIAVRDKRAAAENPVSSFVSYGSTDTDIARAVKAKTRAAQKRNKQASEHKSADDAEGFDATRDEASAPPVWSQLIHPEVDPAYEHNKIVYDEQDEATRPRSCCEKIGLSRFWHTTEGYYRGLFSSFPKQAIDHAIAQTPTAELADNASLAVITDDSAVRAEPGKRVTFGDLPSFTRRLVVDLVHNVRDFVLGYSAIHRATQAHQGSADQSKVSSPSGYVAPPLSPLPPTSPTSQSSSVECPTLDNPGKTSIRLPLAPGSTDDITQGEKKTAQAAVANEEVAIPSINPKWIGSFERHERMRLLTLIWGHLWPNTPPCDPAEREAAIRYLRHMALSSTTKPFFTPQGDLDWQFESAEELAMVRFAASCGFIKETDPNSGSILLKIVEFHSPELILSPDLARVRVERYNQIATFGFSSRRARVTVVWQRVDNTDPAQEGSVHIMCKGQDTMILPLLGNPNADRATAGDRLMSELSDMSVKGLRTLVACYAETTDQWWSQWSDLYQYVTSMDEESPQPAIAEVFSRVMELAQANGLSRDSFEVPPSVKRLREDLYEVVERAAALRLLGCIGMEDKLQHFVPESIADFARAGIKVWMITGDKLETARNIALACNLIDSDMSAEDRLIEVTGEWAGIGQDPMRQRALFDALVAARQKAQYQNLGSPSPTAAAAAAAAASPRVLSPTSKDQGTARVTVSVGELRKALTQQYIPLPHRLAIGASRNGAASPGLHDDAELTFDEFSGILSEIRFSLYDAVRTQVDIGLSRYIELSKGTVGGVGQASLPSASELNEIEDQLQAAAEGTHSIFQEKQTLAMTQSQDDAVPAHLVFGSNAAPPISLLVNRDAFRLMFPGKTTNSSSATSRSASSPKPHSITSMSQTASREDLPEGQFISLETPSEEDIEELKRRFFMLASVCKSVVFARAEPAMKKKMVTEMMSRYPHIVTLAIGDGANDTEMITAANIGIGISGVEGTAATNAADYALGSFRMLHTLLFVHGFWCYKRVALLVNFMFYKAALLSFSNFFFGILSRFSGQQLFVEILYQLYNVVFTAMPITVLGVLDRALPAEVLDNIPEAYREAKGNRFGGVIFGSWIVRSFLHSLICFFIPILPMLIDGNDVLGGYSDRGKTFGHYYFSTIQLTSISILPNLLILFFMDSITLFHIFSCVFSILMVWLFSGMFAATQALAPEFYGHFSLVFSMPQTWLCIFLSLAIPLLMELVWKFVRLQLRPTLTQVIRERTWVRSQATLDAVRSLVLGEELKNGASALHLFAQHCRSGGDLARPRSHDDTADKQAAVTEVGREALEALRRAVSPNTNPDGYRRERRRILQIADTAANTNMMFTPDDDSVWKRQGRGQKVKVTKMDVRNREIYTGLKFNYTRILRQLKDGTYIAPTRAEHQTHMPLQRTSLHKSDAASSATTR